MGVHWSANFKALGDKLYRVLPKKYFGLKLIRAFPSALMGYFWGRIRGEKSENQRSVSHILKEVDHSSVSSFTNGASRNFARSQPPELKVDGANS
jgi:hypothetical protein